MIRKIIFSDIEGPSDRLEVGKPPLGVVNVQT